MLNILEKNIFKKRGNLIKKLNLREIKSFYISLKDNFKIGVEYERLSLDKNTLCTASYKTMSKIIEHFCSAFNWTVIYDGDCIIGACDLLRNSISLEPGMQLEISLAPANDLNLIKNNLYKIIVALDNIAKIYNVIFLGYGINPVQEVDDIEILDKKRYKIMDKYLPYALNGELSQKMMRKTAGIQINIDYFSNFDLYEKLYLANIIMPFVQALSANSPFENNKMTDFKSSRAYVWRYTGSQRCNFFYKNIFKNPLNKFDPIGSYIDEVLKVPMIYIEKDDENILINGKINFLQYMKSKNGYFNNFANLDDYILHQSLCFPDVRLKQYIEIRNHDSSSLDVVLALCALYKGIFQNDYKKLKNKLNFIKLDEVDMYSMYGAKYGLDFSVSRKVSAWNVIKTIVSFAKENLNSSERMFLTPFEAMIEQKKTQADKIIEKYPKNVYELFELSLKY